MGLQAWYFLYHMREKLVCRNKLWKRSQATILWWRWNLMSSSGELFAMQSSVFFWGRFLLAFHLHSRSWPVFVNFVRFTRWSLRCHRWSHKPLEKSHPPREVFRLCEPKSHALEPKLQFPNLNVLVINAPRTYGTGPYSQSSISMDF